MRCYARNFFRWIVAAVLILCYTLLILLWQVDVPRNQVSQWSQSKDGVASVVNAKTREFFQERSPRSLQNLEHENQNFILRIPAQVTTAKDNLNTTLSTNLNDLFISVKTTKNFHQSRLNVILQTWFVLAREQTYFFTDADDAVYSSRTRGHFINTNCSSSHNRKALCCKMSVEFDAFLDSSKKWFCHFDDDNYVNVPRLVKLLQTYNPQEDWYLGKPSIRSPLEIISRYDKQKNISFWFATGGAGFCISRALALKMLPIASGGKFISIGEKIRLPDDVTMGYIIEHILQKKLTVVDLFHSHFEPMKFLKQESFVDQISFSYSRFGHEMNVLKIDGFDEKVDPTRFLSLHCHLFPNFSFCPS
ncbi:fringe glycosyltransferase [Trichonephila inaurata madagascariensis]|uniref:Fringe glycosyltransferase n=1 Tax=Trichonephila inaurata madagascariensis TaxID=2747483 RepID=A0A8X6XWZ7_9ARAC|nr:fringe glycosyltransferase [Trichonephila inaurata madagascariensis]